MKNYDFLLIEPWYWSPSHYNYDQKNLADILTRAGYRVVVINFVKDNKFHDNQKYDSINLHFEDLFPDEDYLKGISSKIKLPLKRIVHEYRRYKYFKKLFHELGVSYKYLYLGTYLECTFPILLNNFDRKKILLWGHRSHLFFSTGFNLKKNPYTALKYSWMRKKIFKNENISLIVSNKFIKDEFIAGGIKPNRLIERPERTLEKLPEFEYEKLNAKFTLLTVGRLREGKNIEFSFTVVKDMNLNFIIAGKSASQYSMSLDKKIKEMKNANIIRKDEFIPDEEYHDLFMESHFVLIADKMQNSTASSGTLLDALLKGRPVIVPDQRPYNYYIDNYGVGIKYQPNSNKSLSEAINNAERIGCKAFKNKIIKFQEEYLIEKVALNVKRQLNQIGFKLMLTIYDAYLDALENFLQHE